MDALEDNHDGNGALGSEALLKARLQELRKEFQIGEAQLAELDRKRAQVRDTLLRISGAIQVLEELLGQDALDGHMHDTADAPEMPTVAAG